MNMLQTCLFTILTFIFCKIQIYTCSGSGYFKLLSYNKTSNTLPGGTCCDAAIGIFCPPLCDPVFKVCFDKLPPTGSCSLAPQIKTPEYQDQEHIVFGSNLGSVHVPNRIGFNFSTWTGFAVKVVIEDNNGAQPYQSMDTLTYTAYPNATKFGSENVVLLDSGHSRLQMSLTLTCDQYYYGDCTTYCKAVASSNQVCNQNGTKICREGWEGPSCNTRVDPCRGHPCKHSGTCIPYHTIFHCVCVPPFTGKICDQQITTLASSSSSTKTPTATTQTSILTNPVAGTTIQHRTTLYTNSPISTVFIPHNVTTTPTNSRNISISTSKTTNGSSYITAVPGASKQEKSSDAGSLGGIIGGIVAGVAVLSAAFILLGIIIKKKAKQKTSPTDKENI